MTKVFNRKTVDWTKQLMFFGDEPNTQRFDQQKYPVFEKLNQQQLGFFWRPEEVSLQKDRNDYNLLSDEQKHIFTSNLKYQTLLDSVQGRGMFSIFTFLFFARTRINARCIGILVKQYTVDHTLI